MEGAHESQSTEPKGNCYHLKDTLLCPHCGQKMKKWATPDDPFSQWDAEFLYICFNDACPYFVNGWKTMGRQGHAGISYRLAFDPQRNSCMPIPVASSEALRGWIVS